VSSLVALRVGVERQERELHAAFGELAMSARSVVDPTRWVQDRPLICVLGALAFGLWLGGRGQAAQ
jgi:hypothetical protein